MVLLHLLPPIAVTVLFLVYYAFAGYHIIPDVRSFFIILQMYEPIFISIAVTVFIHLDRNVHGLQTALGLVESRGSLYLGKILFLVFFSSVSMIIYEGCFYAGVPLVLDAGIIHAGFYISIFCIFLFSNFILYLLHTAAAFRFGSGISVLLGICGTIFAGILENPIGDKIWPLIPWEWGIRFLKNYFGFSKEAVIPGMIALAVMTSIVLILSILWFVRWEGNVAQE